MMSFCRKSVHSLLSLAAATNSGHHHHDQNLANPSPTWPKLGLVGLLAPTNDNVLESTAVAIAKPSPALKKDPGGIGFIDDIGGGVDGLMSCTESLGFESSDERRADDESALSSELSNDVVERFREGQRRRRRRTTEAKKKFPPPISSLDRNGRPSFFLRPVRKDGRLELTEVRINRPEILRAYRGDGRLRLQLITDDDLDCIDEEQKQENTEENDDRLLVSNANTGHCNGEGFRRCHEEVNHHHHHHHHHRQNQLWRSQHCVTTR